LSYRWVEHTSELELAIEARSEREVLEQALVALAELLGAPAGGSAPSAGSTPSAGSAPSPGITPSDGSPETRRVVVTASDRPALLAGWLEELVFLAEMEGFVAAAVRSLDFRGDSLEATVAGAIGDPPALVKAVTYHRLAFEPAGEGFIGRVVLDV
jgi:SHS2 domain-containing protein